MQIVRIKFIHLKSEKIGAYRGRVETISGGNVEMLGMFVYPMKGITKGEEFTKSYFIA